MILCDTNILIEFYRNSSKIVQELRLIGAGQVVISVVTQAELYYGARDKGELARLKKHLSTLHHLPIDSAISTKFIDLMAAYCLSHRISVPDALIGATALVHDMEFYTLNLSDFRYIPGIKLYKPISY
jgi:tRNA(fMet)-specific endonuclease VapC